MDSPATMRASFLICMLLLFGATVSSCFSSEPEAPPPPAPTAAEPPAGPLPAPSPPRPVLPAPPPPPRAKPYEEVAPAGPQLPTAVRVAVLSSRGRVAAGQQMALILSNYQRKRLEKELGRPVEVAFVSSSSKKHGPKTQIRYRPKYLKAAIHLATAIPHEQELEPMRPEELERRGVDVFIYVGHSVR